MTFLDEDNTVDPAHYGDLLRAVVTAGAKWGHSLRRIISPDGDPVCEDRCESLGGITHTVNGAGDYLVDTSCYLIDRDLAVRASPAWNAKARDPTRLEADREMCKTLLSLAPHAVSRKHSLAYRVGSNDRSVSADFFVRGNAICRHDFRFEDVYLFHFGADHTRRFLSLLHDDNPRTSHALDEWHMTLWRGVSHTHGGWANLIDGYSNAPNIPHGATCLIAMCDPAALPLDFFATRKDLRKIVYTLESPNVRHAAQWDYGFLEKHFTHALTYYGPLLRHDGLNTTFAAHNCHHGDLDDSADRAMLLRENRGDGTCVMVLERRPDLYHRKYHVNGNSLESLDHLREDLVRGLADVTVHGLGWADVADGNAIKLGGSVHRSADTRHAVDIMQDYTFAVIVENCEAEGYASEKLYDALSAGCIPLYYGWVPEQLGIPEGPDAGVYIDLRKRGIRTGEGLQALIDRLTDDDVAAMKRRVIDGRESILRRVGVHAFAELVRAAMGA